MTIVRELKKLKVKLRFYSYCKLKCYKDIQLFNFLNFKLYYVYQNVNDVSTFLE